MKNLVLSSAPVTRGEQLRGYACGLCGARLYRDRPLGWVADPYSGEPVQLWGCAPKCSGRRKR